MVSCVCKAAYWCKDNRPAPLRRNMWPCGQHWAGSLEYGTPTLYLDTVLQVLAGLELPTPGLSKSKWEGGIGGVEACKLEWGSLQCSKIKAKFFWMWLAVHWKSRWESSFWPIFLCASIFSSAKCGQKFLPYHCEDQMHNICGRNRCYLLIICNAPGTVPSTRLLPHLTLTRTL